MFSKRRGCYETLLAAEQADELDPELQRAGRHARPRARARHPGHPRHADDPRSGHAAPSSTTARTPRGGGLGAGVDPGRQPHRPVAAHHRRAAGQGGGQAQPRASRATSRRAEGELEAIKAALIVPLKVENKLNGILLLGEKLSGEIFDDQELEVLLLLANQAAISLENARLYEGLATSNARLMRGQPAEVAVPRQHVARAADAAELDHRLLEGAAQPAGRRAHRAAGGLRPLGPQLQPAPAGADQQHPRLLAHRGRASSRCGRRRSTCTTLVEECIESSMPLVRDKR